jgi:hypothetical protein
MCCFKGTGKCDPTNKHIAEENKDSNFAEIYGCSRI